MDGQIYLLHFDKPIGNADNPHGLAQHYLGYTDAGGLATRFWQHVRCHVAGSPLVAAAVRAGITVRLARVWNGSRSLERHLKNRKKSRKICPICRGEELPPTIAGWIWYPGEPTLVEQWRYNNLTNR